MDQGDAKVIRFGAYMIFPDSWASNGPEGVDIVTCPECGEDRPADDFPCEHCGHEWPEDIPF